MSIWRIGGWENILNTVTPQNLLKIGEDTSEKALYV